MQENRRLTKKERRVLRQQNQGVESPGFFLQKISPLTDNQRLTFESYEAKKNLVLLGSAGTGKSFLGFYLGIKEIIETGGVPYRKLCVVRSAVPTREIGFLPGSDKDKAKVYEQPYYAIATELFARGDAYEVLKQKNIVQFITTSYIRGMTLNDSIVLVDEIANMTFHELDSVITRIGKNCKIIFCGDFKQTDFIKDADRRGLGEFVKILRKMKEFEFIEFTEKDIVRSHLVKSYLINKERISEAGDE